MISGRVFWRDDPEVIYLFNYPQQSSAFPPPYRFNTGLVLAASLSLPSRIALETISRLLPVIGEMKHRSSCRNTRCCQHFFCRFWLRIPHCCLIPAGLKWHKLGDSFDISDVPLTHQLCGVTLNFLTLTVSFRGDSEEIVKFCLASIQQSVQICSFGSETIFFGGLAFAEGAERLQIKQKIIREGKKEKRSSTGGEIVQLGPDDYPQMHLLCGQRRRRMPGMNNRPVSFIDFP